MRVPYSTLRYRKYRTPNSTVRVSSFSARGAMQGEKRMCVVDTYRREGKGHKSMRDKGRHTEKGETDVYPEP